MVSGVPTYYMSRTNQKCTDNYCFNLHTQIQISLGEVKMRGTKVERIEWQNGIQMSTTAEAHGNYKTATTTHIHLRFLPNSSLYYMYLYMILCWRLFVLFDCIVHVFPHPFSILTIGSNLIILASNRIRESLTLLNVYWKNI